VAVAAQLPVLAASSPCPLLTDPVGDASLSSHADVSAPGLDVLAANILTGPRNLTFVVHVAELGPAAAAGPRLDQWRMYFTFRGHAFAASAMRALDGTRFAIEGDVDETSSAPGFTPSSPVDGSFDEARNEVRIVVPRDRIGHTRSGDRIARISVDTMTGVGTLFTSGAYAGYTVDRTSLPGPSTTIGSRSCET
jgi:hypothetical protein